MSDPGLKGVSQKGKDAMKDVFKTQSPGWATERSTSAFRAINFELFVKPVSAII